MPVIMKSHILNRLNDEEFFLFCQEQRDLKIERTAQGEIIIMPPTGFETGDFNSELNRQLGNWNFEKKTGKVTDSSTGYILPNGATRSPDAAWISLERLAGLTRLQLKKFPPVCPDFVVEIRSETDHLKTLQDKMEEYIQNGARLGWLIDPGNEKVYIYRQSGNHTIVEGFDQILSGEDVLPGFELMLDVFPGSE